MLNMWMEWLLLILPYILENKCTVFRYSRACCLLYPIEIFWKGFFSSATRGGNLLRRLRRRRKRKSSKMDFPCNNKIMDSIMKLWCPARGDQQYSKNKRGFETFSKIKKKSVYYCSTTRKIRLCNSVNEILFRFPCTKSPFW